MRLMPDVVLMDVRMPEMDGIEATRRLKAARPTVGVIALSSMEEQRAVRDMLVAGAAGYVLKDSDGDAIVHAVREAVSGGALLSPEVTPVVIEELTDALDRERRRARQLEMAQEALLERAAHRQQLIGRVGHELRTPVTVILGIAQTMQRGQLPAEDLEEALDTLVVRAEGLARLVQRFEGVDRGRAHRMAERDRPRPRDLDDRPRIRVEADTVPAMTTLNRTAGLRIFDELVANALAFSARRTARDAPGVSDRGRPHVRVIDRGPGIEPTRRCPGSSSRWNRPSTCRPASTKGSGSGSRSRGCRPTRWAATSPSSDTGPDGSTFLWSLATAV